MADGCFAAQGQCPAHETFGLDCKREAPCACEAHVQGSTSHFFTTFFHEGWSRKFADAGSDPAQVALRFPELLRHDHPAMTCDACGASNQSHVVMRTPPPVFTLALVWDTMSPDEAYLASLMERCVSSRTASALPCMRCFGMASVSCVVGVRLTTWLRPAPLPLLLALQG